MGICLGHRSNQHADVEAAINVPHYTSSKNSFTMSVSINSLNLERYYFTVLSSAYYQRLTQNTSELSIIIGYPER